MKEPDRMSTPMDPRKDNESTYFVQDKGSEAELVIMDSVTDHQQLSASSPEVQSDQAATGVPLHLTFASGDLTFWTAEGEAFLSQPIRGDKFVTSRARPGLISLGGDYWDGPYPVGNLNTYWISTEDHLTGTLTSDEFPLVAQFPWFSFLISGSDDITACSVALLVKATATNAQKFAGSSPLVSLAERGDFYQVFVATGHGNEIMRRVSFDASGMVGELACIRVTDQATAGHINVDDFQFSAVAPQALPLEEGGGDPAAPVWGFADIHTHPMAHLAFGGVAFWGKPDGPLETALPWCTPVHGLDGTGIAGEYGNILMAFFEQVGYGLDIGHRVGGYPQFDGWPRFTSLLHQQMHVDWIRRAYDGGLRLLVAHAVNNELLAQQYNGHPPYDDRNAVEVQIAAMKELVARHADWMEVAYTPADARRIIRQNKLAIVLGVEVDSLGNWKDPTTLTEADILTYLHHLYNDLGIRHLFPVHQADNVFAGSAIYNDVFSLTNHFLHNTYFQLEDGSALGIQFRLEEDPGPASVIAHVTQGYWPPYAQVSGGHINKAALTDHGCFLLQQMMRLGMLIEIDHMSHKAVEETLMLAEQNDYPVVAGHTGFRELTWRRHTETESIHKCCHEEWKSAEQVERIRRLGGMVAPLANLGDVRDVGDVIPALKGKVRAASAGSSRTWAQAYLYAVAKMGGRSVAIGTDSNGFAKFNGPRFGLNASYFLDYNIAGMGIDPERRLLRKVQVEAQENGVRYDTPIVDVRHYRFEGVLEGDVYDDVDRDIWQAVGLYKAGCNPWTEPDLPDITDRVAQFAKGFFATSANQLEHPGLFTGDAPWQQRAAFLVKSGQKPAGLLRALTGRFFAWIRLPSRWRSIMERIASRVFPADPPQVYELYPKVLAIWQKWQAMEGANPPLKRSLAGQRDFDINIDGVAHYGMLPDLIQDLKNSGLTDEDLLPLFRSAEDYIQMWEKCIRRSAALTT